MIFKKRIQSICCLFSSFRSFLTQIQIHSQDSNEFMFCQFDLIFTFSFSYFLFISSSIFIFIKEKSQIRIGPYNCIIYRSSFHIFECLSSLTKTSYVYLNCFKDCGVTRDGIHCISGQLNLWVDRGMHFWKLTKND